jgi:hypothetical protein
MRANALPDDASLPPDACPVEHWHRGTNGPVPYVAHATPAVAALSGESHMDRTRISRALSSHLRSPRFQLRAAGALTAFLALQAVTACASVPGAGLASDGRTSAERAAAATGPRLQPILLNDTELRLASGSGTLYDALASLRPDILLGRHPASVAPAGERAAVYVNGLRMRDADALRNIPTMYVRRVELMPLFGEPRSRGSRYQPGTIHVTLRPIAREPLMALLRTLH